MLPRLSTRITAVSNVSKYIGVCFFEVVPQNQNLNYEYN